MKKVFLKYLAEKIDELLTKADEQMATKTDLAEKVDKVDGKGLSTNDYTTAEKNKLAGIQEGAQKNKVTSVRGALELYPQVGDVVISAGSIGLGDANTRLTALENDKLDKSEKGATNGVASLDENGRVPSSQLPSYVDDVIDDYTYAQFPATGETGKIYIAKDTNKTYRWSGSGYAEISASLALGETEQTAYSGAKGKKNAEDIATHTQQIANLDNNKLGKTEKAADSAKSDNASALIPKSTTVTSVTNTSLTYHLVLADDTGSLPRGDNANALITIPTLNGNLKYLHQLGFTSNGLFHRKFYNKDVDSATPWSQIAFTDSTVANANSAATSSSLTVNGITSDVTYGTTAGIIQNTGDNPTGYWWNKFRILHNNSRGYFTELAMPFKATSGLYYRAMETGVLSEWYKIPFASEIPTLALQGKTGYIPYSSPNATPVGWYRIGVTTRTSQQGWAFRMMLRRHFNYNATESYIIDASIGYASGAASNVYFTQIAGGIYNSRLIDKVRVTVASNSKSYIDLHISADCKNNLDYFLDGDAEAYAEGIIVTEETAATYEFSTVNGLAASHDITAPKFIGALQGNADSATKLATARKIWGQSFDGTGDISGDISLPYPSGEYETSKIAFTGDYAYRGPYIKAVGYGGYGRKKWQLFQQTEAAYPSSYANHTLAIEVDVNGNVGIGKTNPAEKLDVAGNIKASGMLITGSDAQVDGEIVVEEGIRSRGDIDASGNNIKGNLSGTIDRVANTGDNATPIHILGLPTEDNNTPLIDTGVTVEGGVISAEGFKTSGTVEAATLNGNLDGTIKAVMRDANLFLLGFAQEAGAAAKPYVTTQVSVNNGVLTIKGLRVEGDVEITGNTVIGGRVTSAASYQSSPISTTSEEGVPTTEEQLRAQISTLEERIEALEQLIAQNNG